MSGVIAKKILPYRNFKFRVYFEGKPEPVALISKMGALKRTTEVLDWREGGDSNSPRKLCGKTKFEVLCYGTRSFP